MDQRFTLHNLHRESRELFTRLDPQLKRLSQLSLQFTSPLLQEIPTSVPGIYTLTGGRQVGKSTFIKQLILQLLDQQIDPNRIYVITGEYITDYQDLIRTIERFLQSMEDEGPAWIFIDEITYIDKWQLALKHLADTGQIGETFFLLSGSDSTAIRESIQWLPGRRGAARIHDYIYRPLSFRETIQLRNPSVDIEQLCKLPPEKFPVTRMEFLYREFNAYLITGGFLTAINDYYDRSEIPFSTLNIYAEWIRGDILKHGKNEHTLKEILEAILKREGSQITWNNLLSDLSVGHPATVADYIGLLETMQALFVQSALKEHTLKAAPKKAKKVYFTDPFIRHAVLSWLEASPEPFHEIILPSLEQPTVSSVIVESVVINHIRRHTIPYYIKGKGEVDVALVHKHRIWALEIKWRNQIRAADIKELQRFTHKVLLTKQPVWEQRDDILYMPIPLFLLQENFPAEP